MQQFKLILSLLAMPLFMMAQAPSKTWNPNLSGGRYQNPIINADYSDPDVCRHGDDYYMTSSSLLASRAFRYSILPIWSTGLSLVRH